MTILAEWSTLVEALLRRLAGPRSRLSLRRLNSTKGGRAVRHANTSWSEILLLGGILLTLSAGSAGAESDQGICPSKIDLSQCSMTQDEESAFFSTRGILVHLQVSEDGTATPTTGENCHKVRDLVALSRPGEEADEPSLIAIANTSAMPYHCEIPLEALHLSSRSIFAGFDRRRGQFMPPLQGKWIQDVGPHSLELVSVVKAGKRPVVIGSTGIGRGGEDNDEGEWEGKDRLLTGASMLLAKERYEVWIQVPGAPGEWLAREATIIGAQAGTTIEIFQTGPWARLVLSSPEDASMSWQIAFDRQKVGKPSPVEVRCEAKPLSARQVRLSCYSQGRSLLVRRCDGASFVQSGTWLEDSTVRPDTSYAYTLYPLSWRKRGEALAQVEVKTPALPPKSPLPTVYLSDLSAQEVVNGWNGNPRKDSSIEDNPLRIRGEIFPRGMGVHAVSQLVYPIEPKYKRFVAVVGVDDEKNAGSVVFEVLADGTSLFASGTLTPQDPWVNVDVALPQGAKLLKLVVGDAGDGIGCDHADWANAGFITD